VAGSSGSDGKRLRRIPIHVFRGAMTASLKEGRSETGSTRADPRLGRRAADLLGIAAVVETLAMAVVAGATGSAPWSIVRLLVVLTIGALAILAVVRGSSRVRGTVALVLGILGIVTGIGLGVMRTTHATSDPVAVAGLVGLAAGLVLMVGGTVAVARTLSRPWRWLLLPAGVVLVVFVLYPVPSALYATNVPRPSVGSSTPGDFGMDYADVSFPAADGVRLAAWYVPSRNRAALVLLHGASSTRSSVLPQASVLARHGYGVLLVDARGHGDSDGTAMDFGWYGDQDIIGAVSYLATRGRDVDPGRIAVVGMSMGGEEAVGAAAADRRIRAVVAEGVTGRVLADRGWLPGGWRGAVQRGIDGVLYATADLLTEATPPSSLQDAVHDAAPTPVLLIAGGGVMANTEEDAGRWIQAGSPDTVDLWVVPGSGHTGGLGTTGTEWESRVNGFLDDALLR
jgi:uncharacterized protein